MYIRSPRTKKKYGSYLTPHPWYPYPLKNVHKHLAQLVHAHRIQQKAVIGQQRRASGGNNQEPRLTKGPRTPGLRGNNPTAVLVVLAAAGRRRNEAELAAQGNAGYRRDVAHEGDGDGKFEIDLPHVRKSKSSISEGALPWIRLGYPSYI